MASPILNGDSLLGFRRERRPQLGPWLDTLLDIQASHPPVILKVRIGLNGTPISAEPQEMFWGVQTQNYSQGIWMSRHLNILVTWYSLTIIHNPGAWKEHTYIKYPTLRMGCRPKVIQLQRVAGILGLMLLPRPKICLIYLPWTSWRVPFFPPVSGVNSPSLQGLNLAPLMDPITPVTHHECTNACLPNHLLEILVARIFVNMISITKMKTPKTAARTSV